MKIPIAVIANGPHSGHLVVWTDETTDYPQSNIGVVTLVDTLYGPSDPVPGTDFPGQSGRTAAQICVDSVRMDGAAARHNGRFPIITPEEREILARFCAQWPVGPQVQ